jgi:hypothetical protein
MEQWVVLLSTDGMRVEEDERTNPQEKVEISSYGM